MERKDEAGQRDRAAELNRFWDIDALLPAHRVPPRSRNTDAAEVTVAPAEATGPDRKSVV